MHGCLEPAPVPGQCSFPRNRAVHLCSKWARCMVVNCGSDRLDCQARGSSHILLPSFNDAEAFLPVRDEPNKTCTARLGRKASAPVYAGPVSMLNCSSMGCTLLAAPTTHVQRADKRLRVLQHQRQLIEANLDLMPLMYSPVTEAPPPILLADLAAPLGEQRAYEHAFAKHYFLADAQYIYNHFFPTKRNGFFIEVGGLNGAADGSNSFFFERYMGWRGLMVEASPINFAKLFTRRPLAFRLEAALGPHYQTLQFSGDGCCGKVMSNNEGYQVRSIPIGFVLKAMGIQRVDFWSLDVEGSELSVLEGMDWTIHVSVLLIESVNEPIRNYLRARNFEYHRYSGPSRLNEIWVNKNGVS